MAPWLQTEMCLAWTGRLNTSWPSSGNMFPEKQTWCWWDTPSAATLFWRWWREILNSRQVTIHFLFWGYTVFKGTTFIRRRVIIRFLDTIMFYYSESACCSRLTLRKCPSLSGRHAKRKQIKLHEKLPFYIRGSSTIYKFLSQSESFTSYNLSTL